MDVNGSTIGIAEVIASDLQVMLLKAQSTISASSKRQLEIAVAIAPVPANATEIFEIGFCSPL
jgi:hypothetical protein